MHLAAVLQARLLLCLYLKSVLARCRARLAMVTLFQLPVTLRLTTLFHTSYCLPHTSYCLPPVSVACYIPLLPRPTSCIYRGLSAIQNKQGSYTTVLF